MTRSVPVLLLLALGPACAGLRGSEPVPIPEGSYRVTGTVSTHAITGRLELYENIVFFSNVGNCMAERVNGVAARQQLVRDRRIQLDCDLRLVFTWDADGRLSGVAYAPVQEQRQRQGECIRPEYDALGRMRRCLKYDVVTETVTTMVSGRLLVERVNG